MNPGNAFGASQALLSPKIATAPVSEPVVVAIPETVGGAVPSSVVVTVQAGVPARTVKSISCGLVPPVNVTISLKSITSGHATVFRRAKRKGVVLLPLAPPGRFG